MDHGTHDKESSPSDEAQAVPKGKGGGMKHWGLMVLCCAPMVVIVLLLAFGVWNR